MSDDDMRAAPLPTEELFMTEARFDALIPDEESAINYFFNIRFPEGLYCLKCRATSRVYRYNNRPKICRCKNCDNTFSIFKDTIFEKSKSPIREWLKAMRRFLNDMYGFTSMNLWRDQEMSKETAWRRLMQFRIAMGNEEEPEVFSGTVEADETFVGGKGQRYPKSRSTGLYLPKEKRKSGRATDNTAVFGMKERTSRHVHAKVMPFDAKGERLTGEQLLSEFEIKCKSGTDIITDEYPGYIMLEKRPKVDLSLLDDSDAPPPSYGHHTVCHKTGRFTAGPGIHTNGIEGFWSRLKGTFDTYRGVKDKYMQRYVDEACFRQNTLSIRSSQEEFDLLLRQCVLK
jgi:transposase-like protein